jgi:hypothetical protein
LKRATMKCLVGWRRVLGPVLVLTLLAGCSGLKVYPNNLAKNLQIRTVTKSGSIFSKVRARVDVYRIEAPCRLEYEGTVDLDRPVVAVGIPTGRPSYLAFVFASSVFLGGNQSATTQETLLAPRVGYRYDVDVSYENDIYNVVLRERAPRGNAGREIAIASLDTLEGCTAR